MTIKAGDTLPDAQLTRVTPKGPQPVKIRELFADKKVVLFAVPGAFTPTCSNQHLPGFIQNAKNIKNKGVDIIACVSVNDAFVMGAWGKQYAADQDILMLADGNGAFTKALGLDMDASAFGMGLRSARYAMIIDNLQVTTLSRETNPAKAEESGADAVLKQL